MFVPDRAVAPVLFLALNLVQTENIQQDQNWTRAQNHDPKLCSGSGSCWVHITMYCRTGPDGRFFRSRTRPLQNRIGSGFCDPLQCEEGRLDLLVLMQ